jgi:hypothetical protein
MSDYYHLACVTCRKRIRLGQTGNPLYYGIENIMKALAQFLADHEDHTLWYLDIDVHDEVYGYEEVKP